MERALRKTLLGGRFTAVTSLRRRIMQSVRGSNNRSTELRLRGAMVRAGLRGWRVRPRNVQSNPDFLFRRKRLAVYVDGCFWHGCDKCYRAPKLHAAFWKAKIERNQMKDRAALRLLKSQGYSVLRFWEHELSRNLTECLDRIQCEISSPKKLRSGSRGQRIELRRSRQ